jgi:hypothetical protein
MVQLARFWVGEPCSFPNPGKRNLGRLARGVAETQDQAVAFMATHAP